MTHNGPMTAAEPTADTTNPSSLTELVSGIVSDAQTLIRQQVTMLRAEVKEDVRRTKDAAIYMGIGAGVAALGSLFLVIGVVYLLNYLAPTLPLFACWMIVGGVIVLGGGIAFVVGKRLFNSFNPLPDKTINALQENLSWITNRRN